MLLVHWQVVLVNFAYLVWVCMGLLVFVLLPCLTFHIRKLKEASYQALRKCWEVLSTYSWVKNSVYTGWIPGESRNTTVWSSQTPSDMQCLWLLGIRRRREGMGEAQWSSRAMRSLRMMLWCCVHDAMPFSNFGDSCCSWVLLLLLEVLC